MLAKVIGSILPAYPCDNVTLPGTPETFRESTTPSTTNPKRPVVYLTANLQKIRARNRVDILLKTIKIAAFYHSVNQGYERNDKLSGSHVLPG